ncbi:hypothetical protein F4703DRAFT_1830634 [Phycomyces blakesleeanus]
MTTNISCNCAINNAIQSHGSNITITDAQKTGSDKSDSFVLYIIQFQSKLVMRRYSEFESLKTALTHLHPAIFVPPIPEKHGITDYAHVQKRAKDDREMITKRKRTLQRFLRRLVSHPILCHEHIFHCFLDTTVMWSTVLNQPPLSNTPKDIWGVSLPTDLSFASLAKLPYGNFSSSSIPVPSASHVLKSPDPRFLSFERTVDRQTHHLHAGLDKSQRRFVRRLGELTNDANSLGSVYNSLGLNETGPVATAIANISKATHNTGRETRIMVRTMESEVSELMHEYSQYTRIAKDVLNYWRLKQAQLELIEASLEQKRQTLERLINTEKEAALIDAAMQQRSPLATSLTSDDMGLSAQDTDDTDSHSIEDGFFAIKKSTPVKEVINITSNTYEYPTGASALAIRESKSRSKKWSSPRKLLDAVSTTIQSMMDVNPDVTRRQQISGLKDTIIQLEKGMVKAQSEVEDVAITIQQEIERFNQQKEKELRVILIAYAKAHIVYCEENSRAWKAAGEKIETNKG